MVELRSSARLEPGSFDPAREFATLAANAGEDGAIVSFVGLARRVGANGAAIDRLVLDHHPRLTEQSLRDIAADALNRFGVSRTLVVHRCGEVSPGGAIVFAAALSRHRRAAFEAADYLMDRLKTDAVFWKREEGASGRSWIEPADTDIRDRNRWLDACPE